MKKTYYPRRKAKQEGATMIARRLNDGRLKQSHDLAKEAFLSIDAGIHVKAYVGVHPQMYAESEFAGKYLDACVNFYKNTKDEAFLERAKEVTESNPDRCVFQGLRKSTG